MTITMDVDYKSLVRDTLAEFIAGKWPYSINGGSTDFSENGEFGKLGSSIEQISKAWKKFPADKKHEIIDYIKDLNNPELTRLLPSQKEEDLYPKLPPSFDYLLQKVNHQWLDDCIAFLRKWSPRAYEGYYEAVALSILSTVAARRVMLDFGGPEYTPLFVALVGESTFFKKTTTAKHYYGILEAAGLDWLLGADITTPQKLLSDMAGKTLPSNYGDMTDDQKEWVKRRLAFAGQVGWYYEEFGMQLDAMVKDNGPMAEFKGLLRVLDDCKSRYRYATHARGNEVIEKPYLTLIAALTPTDMKPHAQRNSRFWTNGLFGRIPFVCPPRGTRFKRDRFPKGLSYPGELTTPLVRWHQWLGEPEIEIEEITNKDGNVSKYIVHRGELPERECTLPDEIEDAYYAYDNALLDMMEAGKIPSCLFTNYGRSPKLALRVAMTLASFDNRGLIQMRHWARGLQFAEARRRDLHEVLAQVSSEDEETPQKKSLADKIIFFMEELLEKDKDWVSLRDIQRDMQGGIASDPLRKELASLEKDGEIISKKEKSKNGREVTYYSLTLQGG